MNKLILSLLFGVAFFFLISRADPQISSSANFQLESGVVVTASGENSSEEFSLAFSAGQAVSAERSWSESFGVVGGFVVEPEVSEIPVDIKPGSCPNPLNIRAKGVLSVAILGTEDVDVMQIGSASVRLAGVPPLRWGQEDVAAPYEPYSGKQSAADCTISAPDGFMDIVLIFDNQAVAAALGPVSDRESRVLSLTGYLLNGMRIVGEDVVMVISKGR